MELKLAAAYVNIYQQRAWIPNKIVKLFADEERLACCCMLRNNEPLRQRISDQQSLRNNIQSIVEELKGKKLKTQVNIKK